MLNPTYSDERSHLLQQLYDLLCSSAQPLDSLKGAQLDQVLVKICQEIKTKAAVTEPPGRDSQGNLGLGSNRLQPQQSSRLESSALKRWQEKLAFLEQELAIVDVCLPTY